MRAAARVPYVIAVVAVGFATGITAILLHTIGPHPAIGFSFLLAIMASAWWGGYGPGIVSCLISMFAIPYLFVPKFAISKVDLSRLLLVLIVSILVSRIASGRKKAEEALRRANEILDERVRQRTRELQTAIEQLRESEERLKLAQSAASIGMWDWDIVKATAICNDEYFQLHGLVRQEGQTAPALEHWRSTVHPDDRARVEQESALALEGSDSTDSEYRIVHPDGVRWLIARARVHRNAAGEAVRMVGVSLDVTEYRNAQHALHESETRLNVALQAGRMGAWEWDIRGNRIMWSPQLEEIHGLPAGGFGGTFEDFQRDIHPDHKSHVLSEIAQAVADRRNYQVEYVIIPPDGRHVWVEARGQMMTDENGEPVRLVGVCMDVTRRKEVETELRQKADELARSNEDLQQFTYVASHDLQEPLRMIASYMQLLSRRYSGKLDDTADEYIHYAVDGVKRMQKLIRDLLGYSRVIHTELDASNASDLNDVLREALSNLQPRIAESGAVISSGELPVIACDRDQFVQVFQNLIGNAMKYRCAGIPRISINAEQSEDGWIVRVRDNGIGIAPQYHQSIFAPFKRLHGREYPGTGVGLAICKRVIERHGGSIWVTSALGEGSEFCFSLPRQRASESPLARAVI
jgi:PAS domain S-box-containing protein